MSKVLNWVFGWLDKFCGVDDEGPCPCERKAPESLHPEPMPLIESKTFYSPPPIAVYDKTPKGLKLRKPRKSRRKGTKPLPTSKRTYKIQYVGGELAGKIEQHPIPRPENKSNPKYLEKSLWLGKEGWKDFYYVAEQVGRPKKGQIIKYHYTPEFRPKKKPARPYGG